MARLDEVQDDALALGTLGRRQRDEFRPAVQAKLRRVAAPSGDAFEVRITRVAGRLASDMEPIAAFEPLQCRDIWFAVNLLLRIVGLRGASLPGDPWS